MHNFKKKFGQNFLKHNRYAAIVAGSLKLDENSVVIEVGPGDGRLTAELLRTNAKVYSIEIDYDLLAKLIKRFSGNPKFEIINQDILTVKLEEILTEEDKSKPIFITGSLPYNISKKIIEKFLKYKFEINTGFNIVRMSFIVQDEVAKDYVAKPPKSSFISNFVQVFAKIKKLQSIPASEFTPRPKVDGGILTFELKTELHKNYNDLIKLIRIGFVAPRKKLIKNISNSNLYQDKDLKVVFEELGISENARPAELGFEQWEQVFSRLVS